MTLNCHEYLQGLLVKVRIYTDYYVTLRYEHYKLDGNFSSIIFSLLFFVSFNHASPPCLKLKHSLFNLLCQC